MTTDIIVRPDQALARQLNDADKLAVLWDTIAPGLYPPEQELFVEVCKNTGLNPFMKQIYAIPRGNGDKRKVTHQVAIDGFRLIAHRTGLHAGTDDAVFEEDATGKPKRASVTVWKLVGSQRFPFTASALFKEYAVDADKSWSQWAIRPHTMIAKCAEALALRKAFPAEMSGIYTEDEMAQADNTVRTVEGVSRPAIAPGVRPPASYPWLDEYKAAMSSPDRQCAPRDIAAFFGEPDLNVKSAEFLHAIHAWLRASEGPLSGLLDAVAGWMANTNNAAPAASSEATNTQPELVS